MTNPAAPQCWNPYIITTKVGELKPKCGLLETNQLGHDATLPFSSQSWMLDLGVGILLEAGSAGTEVEKVVDAGSSR